MSVSNRWNRYDGTHVLGSLFILSCFNGHLLHNCTPSDFYRQGKTLKYGFLKAKTAAEDLREKENMYTIEGYYPPPPEYMNTFSLLVINFKGLITFSRT